jgi:hypothetical protein
MPAKYYVSSFPAFKISISSSEKTFQLYIVYCRFLKQLRRNRDEEAKLMANVPGWVVGTWYGEPVYKTLPPDSLVTPHINEFYVHGPDSEYRRRVNFQFWI